MSKELFESHCLEGVKSQLISTLSDLLDVNEGVGDWVKTFNKISTKAYWSTLEARIIDAYKKGLCFPSPENIFRSLRLCQFSEVKVVIIGQDPYHGINQADGLSFSVPEGIKTPPSLRNIFVERKNDLGVDSRSSDLSDLAKQGVLLLNSVLTVAHKEAGSHSNWGWEMLTSDLIKAVNDKQNNVCFLLWGQYAKNFESLIDTSRHTVFTSSHPSPLSAYRGFLGSKPFSRVNKVLEDSGQTSIIW
jgi:uracil-DNA glycosylase